MENGELGACAAEPRPSDPFTVRPPEASVGKVRHLVVDQVRQRASATDGTNYSREGNRQSTSRECSKVHRTGYKISSRG